MSGAATAGLRFDQRVLPNGLTLVGEFNPDAQSVAVGYFVGTGARDETEEVSGVSHFLEHMMFKGTARRSAADINLGFDGLGAQYNAFTGEERTVYYGAVLPEHVPSLVDLLTDMMRPALRPEDFEMEKNVILEEIAMYEDRPSFRVFEIGGERFWNTHPLGNSILGSQDSVRALTREAMLAYFRRRYAPGNLVLALSGAYDLDAVSRQVEDLTAAWAPFETGRTHSAPQTATGVEHRVDPKLARTHMALFAPGLAVQDDRRYAAALVANAIGDGSGSRLFWALVDRGLADAASLSHDASDGAGAFVGYLSSAPERAPEVLRIAREVLREVEDGGLEPGEWQRAQRKLATGLTLRAETPLGRLVSLGSGYQALGRYESVETVVRAVLDTDVEVGRALLAERPFERLSVTTLGPDAGSA